MSTTQLLRLPDVLRRTALGRSALYEMVRVKKFPAPIRVQRRAVAWVEAEVDDWIHQRIAASRSGGSK